MAGILTFTAETRKRLIRRRIDSKLKPSLRSDSHTASRSVPYASGHSPISQRFGQVALPLRACARARRRAAPAENPKSSIPMATRAPPQSSSTGSVTVTIDPSSSSASPPAPAPAPESVVLRLKRRAKKKVSWKEGTVDNEGLGRKSSKKCCIFHKEVPFDEDCSDDESPGCGGHPCPRPHGDAGVGASDGGGGCSSSSHDHDHGHGHGHGHH